MQPQLPARALSPHTPPPHLSHAPSVTSACGQLSSTRPSPQASSPPAHHLLSAARHAGVCISARLQVGPGQGDLSKPQFPDCQVALLQGPGEIN